MNNYNQQQRQPQYQSQQYSGQGNQNGQGQYEKNPNGGYLNPSNYGQDSWYGPITITPELLREIQQTGKVLIEVKDRQTTQYGECRRITAKPYIPQQNQQAIHGGHQAAPAQQYQAQPQPQPQPQYGAPPQGNGGGAYQPNMSHPPAGQGHQNGGFRAPTVFDNGGDDIPF